VFRCSAGNNGYIGDTKVWITRDFHKDCPYVIQLLSVDYAMVYNADSEFSSTAELIQKNSRLLVHVSGSKEDGFACSQGALGQYRQRD
jgi:hypothetical protein